MYERVMESYRPDEEACSAKTFVKWMRAFQQLLISNGIKNLIYILRNTYRKIIQNNIKYIHLNYWRLFFNYTY